MASGLRIYFAYPNKCMKHKPLGGGTSTPRSEWDNGVCSNPVNLEVRPRKRTFALGDWPSGPRQGRGRVAARRAKVSSPRCNRLNASQRIFDPGGIHLLAPPCPSVSPTVSDLVPVRGALRTLTGHCGHCKRRWPDIT